MEPSDTDSPQVISTLEVSIVTRDTTWNDAVSGIEALCSATAEAAFRATRSRTDTLATANFEARNYEASIVLADDDFVADLNLKYRDRPGPTNVLSFAGLDDVDDVDDVDGTEGLSEKIIMTPDMPVLLGDVIIARGVVEVEAAEMGISINDHLRHMVVHGILHLLGYDHLEEDEALEMEGLETRILTSMAVDDPYAL